MNDKMSENTKDKAGFSVFYGRMACKEAILKTLKDNTIIIGLNEEMEVKAIPHNVIADKIQEALRKGHNHCINDYDVLMILQGLNEEDFISYIDEVVLDCECNGFSDDFRQNLIDKLAEGITDNE